MDVEGRNLVIRADAGPEMGTGHIMRALALGQAWKERGGPVDFVTAGGTDPLIARLEGEGFFVHVLSEAHPRPGDWKGTARALSASEEPWLALDGYHFDTAYQERALRAGASVLVVDDMAHLDRYPAHLIVNQNAHAEMVDYKASPESRLLLGLDYVLLRQEFQPDTRPNRAAPDVARRVLVTFGGTDPLYLAEQAVRALNRVELPGLKATVLAGAKAAAKETLEEEAEASPHAIRVETDVRDVTGWMEWAEVAVCAGGTTAWELAFMGVPALVIATSRPERLLVQGLDKIGLFESWARGEEVNASALAYRLENLLRDVRWRREMSSLGQRLVDGRGRERVVAAMHGSEAT